MDDYISRQALCQYALNQKDKSVTPNDIMRFPSADVVPVVKCKDCRYRVDPDKCCHPDGLLRSKDSDFCSYGERKE